MNETLADLVIRETFRPKAHLDLDRPVAAMRQQIAEARKFVLDEAMSGFVAELSMVPFDVPDVRRREALDSIRHGALLPYPKTWIELDGKAFRRRIIDITKGKPDLFGNAVNAESAVPRWGWLFEEHPQMPHAIKQTEFVLADAGPGERQLISSLPFTACWNCKDEPLPWPNADINSGMIAAGIMAHSPFPQIGVMIHSPATRNKWKLQVKTNDVQFETHKLVAEFSGMVRYALCLLSTLNDVPVEMQEVRPQKGYVARGRYRKFVDHKIVRLTVPKKKNLRLLARRLIAAARRRAHSVRGHWRMFQRGPGVLCAPDQHVWAAMGEAGWAPCQRCSAWRTWIFAHQRGDASLGFVNHDYAVQRGEGLVYAGAVTGRFSAEDPNFTQEPRKGP